MAHQGHSFATAQDVRVVYTPSSSAGELVDVPRDGKTVGEIIMRGNIVMKEVGLISPAEIPDGNDLPLTYSQVLP